jgi:uncharacterized OB-fold protein
MASELKQKTEAKPFLPPNETTQFFWDAAREHRLVIQRCDDCAFYIHWPEVYCPRCGSERLSASEVSGRGTVYTFTIVQHVFHPGFADDVPYSLALIELEEQPGLRVVANIVDCPNDAVRIGMPVEVTFAPAEDVVLPFFRPDR